VAAYPQGVTIDMSKERDRIALTRDAEGSEVGDIGTVVHVYADRKAFEVDFMTLDRKTAAIATVKALAVRPVTSREITHSRDLTRAN
jgi:hypothetical protein